MQLYQAMTCLAVDKYGVLSDKDIFFKYGCVEYNATGIYLQFEIENHQSNPLFLCATYSTGERNKLSIRRISSLGDYNELDFAEIDDKAAVLRRIYQSIPKIVSGIHVSQPHLMSRTLELLAILADDAIL